MKNNKKTSRKRTAPRRCAVVAGSPLIPASKLLRAEATRLDVLKHAMPDAAEDMIAAQVWAYNLAAAYLDALGAPEKLVRYMPSPSAALCESAGREQASEVKQDANRHSQH